MRTESGLRRLGTAVRFYQAEWLPRLGRKSGLAGSGRGGLTPVVNPGSAAVVESKRFPLTWEQLATPLPTWRAILPESREPRQAPWSTDEGWLLKTAFCNTGDTVAMVGQSDRKRWRAAALDARMWPGRWVAQGGSRHCARDSGWAHAALPGGVYGQRAGGGVYGRLGRGAVIDYAATDVAVLVSDDH